MIKSLKTIKYNEDKEANINNQISIKSKKTPNGNLNSTGKTPTNKDSVDIDVSANNVSKNLSNDNKNDRSSLIPSSSENSNVQSKKFVIGIMP